MHQPKLTDLLTEDQIKTLAENIDAALNKTQHFELVLIFDKMGLKYIKTMTGEKAPPGLPPFMANNERYKNG